MESLGKFPDSFLAEIARQPATIRGTADAVAFGQRGALRRIAAEVGARPRIVFSGMGASYFVGYAPVTTLAASGGAACHIDAAELLHFRLPAVGGDTVLVLISQSGESAEPVALAQRLRARRRSERPLVVSMTNGMSNRLAELADVRLDVEAGDEVGPSTVTFAASVVASAAVARSIAGGVAVTSGGRAARDRSDRALDRALDALTEQAERAARAAARLLTADPTEPAAVYARWFGGRSALVTLGRGAARAASEMGALVLKEAARLPAEALATAQFRHGPLELAGPGSAAFVVATEPATAALDRRLARELASLGSAVLLASRDTADAGGAEVVRLGRLDPSLAPAVAVIPMQLLAWRLSSERGFDPTRLRIATKVTSRE